MVESPSFIFFSSVIFLLQIEKLHLFFNQLMTTKKRNYSRIKVYKLMKTVEIKV